ncbi:unnamed protein product [Bursaphelenchus okinawaensis]|uniref:Uncharacterized protein n=1 Tax=Bursaphelenchus okinawaensis TaxID=465554 RepID=A0A811JTN9_9BILA|nr:unnamed protein product [Bursaphelenchus okinawaensis]CAG9082428.1 unnamed protein product [Bursaphelenchus okinawaensis]
MVLKKLWNKFGGEAKTAVFQKKSIEKFEKLEAGEKVLAPKHPTDQKHFDIAQKDERLAKEVRRRNDDLIDKVNKITIHSTEPQEFKSSRPLPTKESEDRVHSTLDYKFGYHEISPEKREKNTIMMREFYEILGISAKAQEEGKEVDLTAHEGYRRLSEEQRANLIKYFGLFVRKEKQEVVDRNDVYQLAAYMRNQTEDMDHEDLQHYGKQKALAFIRKERNKFIDLERNEQAQKQLEEMEKRREVEAKRLAEKLKELEAENAGKG